MADTIDFELVSPVDLLVSEPVEMVVVPGGEGDFGVLPGHTPMISTVRPGVIDIHEAGKVKTRLFVDGGFAEVTPNRITVLAEEAILVSDLDAGQAQERLEKAERNLAEARDDVARIKAEKEKAVAEAMKVALAH